MTTKGVWERKIGTTLIGKMGNLFSKKFSVSFERQLRYQLATFGLSNEGGSAVFSKNSRSFEFHLVLAFSLDRKAMSLKVSYFGADAIWNDRAELYDNPDSLLARLLEFVNEHLKGFEKEVNRRISEIVNLCLSRDDICQLLLIDGPTPSV